jgi:hypothetical protein
MRDGFIEKRDKVGDVVMMKIRFEGGWRLLFRWKWAFDSSERLQAILEVLRQKVTKVHASSQRLHMLVAGQSASVCWHKRRTDCHLC